MSAEFKNICEPCLRENLNVSATFYCRDCMEIMCEECKRHHLKYSPSANHKLHNIGVNENLSQLNSIKKLSKCPNHESEEVKYLCKNHDKLCCNQCAIAAHRKCELIVSLADEVKESSTENSTRARLQEIGKHSDALLTHEKQYQKSIEASTYEIKEFLLNFKTKIDEAYDRLQTKLLLGLTNKSEDAIKESKSQEEAVNELKADVKRSLASQEFAAKFGHNVHSYITEKELRGDIQRKLDSMKKLHTSSSARSIELFEKTPIKELLDSLSDCFDIGAIVSNRNLPPCPGYNDFKKREAILIKEIDLQEGDCYPRYCIWMGKYIVVSLQSEMKLKVFDQESGNSFEKQLNNNPWAMTVLDRSMFAVMSYGIKIMKIENSCCQHIRSIELTGVSTTAGVSFNRDDRQLIVLSQSNETFIILPMDDVGAQSSAILLDQKGKEAAKSAYSFAFDSKLKVLYLLSSGSNKICTINKKGETIFEYTNEHLSYPSSSVIDYDGNIYVASTYGHCIQQINTNGVLIRNVITSSNGIVSPYGICFNDIMTKFAETCKHKGKELKIYKFE
ncbi:uncharacterized protein LOC123558389 [Mercenaria mercenaria]|uniref:uncharacterized protein LOC123558389 n=1 Tax=Mercenaria mercenaria TaxID=6596 RepID=UPI00234F28AC|nr:uncharacterized protein LOC123558389 [Mercenaria mercenaria]